MASDAWRHDPALSSPPPGASRCAPCGTPGAPILSGPHLAFVAAALALWLAAIYGKVLFGGETFALRDHIAHMLPIRTFLQESLWAGRIPEWWDAVELGTPFAANPVHQAFAPVAWLCSALPMPLAADVEPIVYLFIAGLGTALFAARLGAGPAGAAIAGALVEASPYCGSLVVNNSLPHAAWVPWIAWGADRLAVAGDEGGSRGPRAADRAAALLAVLGTLQLIGSEPASAVTAGLLAFAVVLVRGRRPLLPLAWLAAAGATAALLAAFTLLPAVLLARYSERQGGLDMATAATWSMHPWRLIEWIWPHLLGDPVDATLNLAYAVAHTAPDVAGFDPSWSFSLFLGAPVIVLAMAGARECRSKWLLLVAALFLLLALGTDTPLFAAFRAVFPPERYARYPEKHVLGALILFAGFAGVGLSRLLEGKPPRWLVPVLAGTTAALGALLVAFAVATPSLTAWLVQRIAAANLTFLQEPTAALAVSFRGGLQALAAAGLATAGAALARRPAWRRGGAFLVALAAVGLPAHELGSLMRWVPRDAIRQKPPILAAIPSSGSQRLRLFSLYSSAGAPFGLGAEETALWYHEIAYLLHATRFGFQVVPAVNPSESTVYRRFLDRVFLRIDLGTYWRLFGVRWALIDERVVLPPYPWPVRGRAGGVSLVDVGPVRPHAFVATRWGLAASVDQALDALALGDRAQDPEAVVLDGDGPPSTAPANEPRGTCVEHSERPEQIELTCTAAYAGFAVLLDEFAPGWTATVDGVPAPIRRADGLFRAVPVAAGTHRVTFTYRTPGLIAGAAVSIATLLALAAGVVVSRRAE